jgi:carboxy-terminal domain RNA polymerase II polypeptide A small phosphatase
MERRKLLVLDIDLTLVYVSDDESETDEPTDFQFFADDNRCYYGWKRAGLDSFIGWCFDNYAVGIWSAADADYVDEVLNHILPNGCEPVFVWSRKRCSHKRMMDGMHVTQTIAIKNLKKVFRRKALGFQKSDVLIVDDTPTTYALNFGNALPIDRFTGGIDDELERVRRALEILKPLPDVRRVEKRKDRREYLQ